MKILVLAGGISSERDVSLATSAMVCRALRENGHQAAMIDLFLGMEEPLSDLDAFFTTDKNAVAKVSAQTPDLAAVRAMRRDQSQSRIGPQVLDLCRAADLVFIGLHGADGEDGKIQATLDLLGVKYTGSGATSSALAMDKAVAKLIFREAGLCVPAGVLLKRGEPIPATLPCPAVVKPCSGGSSVATTLVEEQEELAAAIEAAFAYDEKVLVEQYIKGREIQCALLGDMALPTIELDYDGKFFDYVAKYQQGVCREICPSRIDPAIEQEVRKLALTAYQALGLAVYSRADFILTESGALYILELNTLPGMTATSLVPQEAAAAGISYNDLVARIVELSLARYA